MRTRVTLLSVGLVVFSCALVVSGQQPRDGAAPIPSSGTASIAGTITIDDAEARPLRLAIVRLRNSETSQDEQQTTTDDAGRFAFPALAPGRFTLSASKPTYITMAYGAKSPTSQGVPIALTDGQHVTIAMKIQRGAVVTGTLLGANGLPATSTQVQVMRLPTAGGQQRLVSGGAAAVDDRGLYRVYGVTPGDYVVQANATPFGFGGVETRVVSQAEVDWAMLQFAQAPGSSGMPAGPAPPRGQTVAAAPVYFPGTTDPTAATLIKLGPGEERAGVDFSLRYVPTSKVEGVIVDPDGQPPSSMQANMLQPDQGFNVSPPVFLRPDRNGKFSAAGVLPGNYVIVARGSAHTSSSGETPAAMAPAASAVAGGVPPPPPPPPPPPGGPTVTLPLWGLLEVPVIGQDVANLVVQLQPGMNVSGRIVFDGTTAQPANLATLRVSLAAAATTGVTVSAGGVQADADGSFRITGVAPGTYRLTATLPAGRGAAGPASPWTLKSAEIAGRDSQDYPADIRAGLDVSDAVIMFTDRPTELSGALLDRSGRPAPDYFMAVFSTDRAFWTNGSRRVKQVRPGSDGRYRLAGLPPGEYYVCALTELEPNQINDATFLGSLVAASLKVTLVEGEKKTQDLRLATN